MARVLISVWIAACGLLISSPGARAEVLFDAAVNRDTLTVGDPVILNVRILRESGDAVALMQNEGFLAPFEVRRRVPPAVRETSDGRVEETLAFELAVYRLGALEVPTLVLQVRDGRGRLRPDYHGADTGCCTQRQTVGNDGYPGCEASGRHRGQHTGVVLDRPGRADWPRGRGNLVLAPAKAGAGGRYATATDTLAR